MVLDRQCGCTAEASASFWLMEGQKLVCRPGAFTCFGVVMALAVQFYSGVSKQQSFPPAHRMGAPERRLRALPDHSACVNPFAHMRKHVDVRNMFASPGIMRLSEPEVTGVCQN